MMNKMKENIEEVTALKAFRAKLEMSRVNVTKRGALTEAQKRDSSRQVAGEFDISGLPLPVKKHIITAGIIQGDIFQYGDGFASIKEVIPSQAKSTFSKTLHLQIEALSPKSYEKAIGIVEMLIDEVLEPRKKVLKGRPGYRSWGKVLKSEFEIQSLMKPVISHLITKGIIKGEIYHSTGAVVNAKGSPYLADDSPQEALAERPIYLLIQGPNDTTLYWAVESIRKIIQEAEEIISNDIPQVISEERAELSKDELEPREAESDVITSRVEQYPQSDVQYPPFLPQLGQTVEADVERCAVLVQWLLAHPLLVSFMACPPEGCESKTISRKMATTVLLCLPLYDQYECSHLTPNKVCSNCYKFFAEAQRAVGQCCEAVANSGYNISKLISVDDYIKDLAADPGEIGVLYDYPLPLNLFYIDNCRLFIDLVVNCGLEIEESHIESYLRSTDQWYPVEAFKKTVVASQVKPSPSKNPKTHQYPLYCSIDHHGGLINFHLGTIGNASLGQLFPADAPKIPRCKYFPFLRRLSVFSKLNDFNKKQTSVLKKQTVEMYGSISLAAYQMTKDLLKNSEPNRSSPHGALEERTNQQQVQPGVLPSSSTYQPSVYLSQSLPHGALEEGANQQQVQPGVLPSSSTYQPSVYLSQSLPHGALEEGANQQQVQPGVLPSSSTYQPGVYFNQSLPHGALEERANQQQVQPGVLPSTLTYQPSVYNPFWNNQSPMGNYQNVPESSVSQLGNEGPTQGTQELPPSFSIMQEPKEKLTPSPMPVIDLTDEKNTESANPLRKQKERGKEEKKKKEETKKRDLQPQLENEEPTQETKNLKGSLPPSFTVMQAKHTTVMPEAKSTPSPIPNPNSKSNTKPHRILRKQKRIEKEEKKKQEINKTIELLKEKHGTNSFWTIDTSELEAENAKEKLAKLLDAQTNSYNLQFGSTQPQTPAMPLLTGSMFPQNLQQVLGNMQLSMPAMQPNLFGTQPLMLMTQESKSILKPALLNAEQILEGHQPGQDDSQMPQDSSQPDAFSEVISKLQEFIQATGTKTAVGMESGDRPTTSSDVETSAKSQQDASSIEQSTASGNSAEDSPFSSIIQQLQQYIDSNSQATSEDGTEVRRTPPADQFKRPLEPVASTNPKETQQTYNAGLERKQESSRLKLTSAERTSESTQPKHLYTEHSSTKPTTPATGFTHQKFYSQPLIQKSGYVKEVATAQQPSISVQKNFGMQSKIISAVGDTRHPTPSTPYTPPRRLGMGSFEPDEEMPYDIYDEYFDSNSQTTSQDNLVTSSDFKKQLEPIASKTTRETQQTVNVGLERKQESSQMKRASTELTSESTRPKRVYIEFSDTEPTAPTQKTRFTNQKSESLVQKSRHGGKVSASQPPSSSAEQSDGKESEIISLVSILGDSLLQRARMHFGGSDDQDRREDSFTVEHLREDVCMFHNKGGQLKPYCLIMCGVNDVIKFASPMNFVKKLKLLINYLHGKGYYILLATLPLIISNKEEINKIIPQINGLIVSFHTKSNLSIIPFHKLCEDDENRISLLKSIHIDGNLSQRNVVVLSDFACKLVRELVEKEVLKCL